MFTLKFVELENEISISIWEFEKMNRNEISLLMNSDTLICI